MLPLLTLAGRAERPGEAHGLGALDPGLVRDLAAAGACSRTCHRAKQRKGWRVTKPRPGWTQWTTKAGRTYLQEPWMYPALP